MIFYASSQSRIAGPDVVGFDKVVHFLVYGLLATLLVRIPGLRREGRLPVLLAVVLTSLYGVTDELHQTFTPGRELDVADWIVDTAGALLAATLYARWEIYRRALEAGLTRRVEVDLPQPSRSSS